MRNESHDFMPGENVNKNNRSSFRIYLVTCINAFSYRISEINFRFGVLEYLLTKQTIFSMRSQHGWISLCRRISLKRSIVAGAGAERRHLALAVPQDSPVRPLSPHRRWPESCRRRGAGDEVSADRDVHGTWRQFFSRSTLRVECWTGRSASNSTQSVEKNA